MMLFPSAALEAYLQAIVRDTVVINAKEFRAFIDSNLDASSRCSMLLRLSRDDWRALTRLFVVPSLQHAASHALRRCRQVFRTRIEGLQQRRQP